jgi:hypothetical protein
MATHLTLICHAATAAMRAGAFAKDGDPVEDFGRAQAAAMDPLRAALAWTSPALAARQTRLRHRACAPAIMDDGPVVVSRICRSKILKRWLPGSAIPAPRRLAARRSSS